VRVTSVQLAIADLPKEETVRHALGLLDEAIAVTYSSTFHDP
jgi:hypothetical protein